MKQILKFVYIVLLVIVLVACSDVTPAPIAVATTTLVPGLAPSVPSITPSSIPAITLMPTNTYTATPEPDTPPGCMIFNEDGKLYTLSEKGFFGFGPSETKLDEVLVDNHLEWASFEQTVSWYAEPVKVGKIVEAASFQEQYSFNPAVTLVTLGESLDWQIPADGDLYSRAIQTSEALTRSALDWINPENEQLRAQYPQIANGATYALYIFFGQDESQLQTWCNTYQQLFGDLPIPIITPSPQTTIQFAITPNSDQVARWQEYEHALASKILYTHPTEEILCEWEILGQSAQDVYVWAVCFGLPPADRGEEYAPRANMPAVIHLGSDGSVQNVEIPGYSSSYAEGVRKLFPLDIQEKILNRLINYAELTDHAKIRRENPAPPLIIQLSTQQP